MAVALFVASPAMAYFATPSQQSPFTGLGLLGPQRTASNYPSEIQPTQAYSVFLDVNNQLGHAAYYMVQVKLVNESQLATPASVPSLGNLTFFVANDNSLQVPLTFSLNYQYLTNQTAPQTHVTQITINSQISSADYFAPQNPQTQQFYTYLVFDLWIYNDTLGGFQNHERSVYLLLTLAP